MTKEVNIPILQAGMTASELMSLNPIGLERQLVLETDTRRAKVLDGVTNYNDLPYWFESGTATVNWGDIGGNIADQTDLVTAFNNVYLAIDDKQDALVNQVNIRSINGNSLLGSGDITVSASISIGTAIGSATAGSVLFAGVGGVLAQDNTNFFWDDTNNRLGIGTQTPDSLLHIKAASASDIGLIVTSASSTDVTTGDFATFKKANGTVSAGISYDNGAVFYTNRFIQFNASNTTTAKWNIGAVGNNLDFVETNVATGRLYLNAGGNVTIGATTSISRFAVPIAPTATANYGLVSLGSGAFDGSTSGFFTGSASGTVLAINAASSSVDLVNYQVLGANVFKIKGNKTVTIYGGDVSGAPTGWPLNVHAGASFSGNPNADLLGLYRNGTIVHYYNGAYATSALSHHIGDSVSLSTKSYKLGVVSAPLATPNCGLVSLGSGAFDGSTSGYFVGSASGTLIAGNLVSGSASDLINLQVAGVSMLKVTAAGNTTLAGTLTVGNLIYAKVYTVATLPAGSHGAIAAVSDSNSVTWGGSFTGGGANKILAYHNGTGWRVMGA